MGIVMFPRVDVSTSDTLKKTRNRIIKKQRTNKKNKK